MTSEQAVTGKPSAAGFCSFTNELVAALEATSYTELTTTASSASQAETMLEALAETVSTFSAEDLSTIICELSTLLFHIRAWYCVSLGAIVLRLLDSVAALPHRLMWTSTTTINPDLAVLRLLEGILLVCTVRHARLEVARVLERLLRRRTLPHCALLRLEAALVSLDDSRDWPGVPARVPLDEASCEQHLRDMARSLVPGEETTRHVADAKRALERVVIDVFAGARVEYFGSGVNGFDTHLSDVDAVVLLEEAAIASLWDMNAEASHCIEGSSSSAASSSSRARNKVVASMAARVLSGAISARCKAGDLDLEVKEVIIESRIPLVKCESSRGVAVDVTFNNALPLHNSRLLRAYADVDDTVTDLGRLVKLWAKHRGLNDVREGTLSSYSYILLVIQYLQHVHLVPNLQDRDVVPAEKHGASELSEFDQGEYTWFLDLNQLPNDAPELEAWLQAAPEQSTLHGLLAGFFRFYAYELPSHSTVVSIRHGCPIDKAAFFHTMLAIDDAAATCRIDNDEWANGGEDPEVSVDEKAKDTEAEGQEEEEEAEDEEQDCEKEAIEEEDYTASATVEGVSELAVPQQASSVDLPRLPQAEHDLQRQLAGRQTLCIADPVERCRTLGTNFNGMERLVRELRRACELTGTGCGLAQITELFSDKVLPSKRRHSNIFEKNQSRSKLRIPQTDVGCLMGRGGARISELRSIQGISSIRVVDAPSGGGTHASVHIVGTQSAVDECCNRVEKLLARQQPSPGNSDATTTTRASGHQPTGKQQAADAAKRRWHPVGASTSAVAEEGSAARETNTPATRGSRWGEGQGPTVRAPRGVGRNQRRW